MSSLFEVVLVFLSAPVICRLNTNVNIIIPVRSCNGVVALVSCDTVVSGSILTCHCFFAVIHAFSNNKLWAKLARS